MLSIWFLILAAAGLGLLVFIHELGHYFVARWVGIKVEAFSIGFGRAVVRWERKGVEWKIGWLPFGGYVRMAGMEKDGEKQPYEVEGGFFHAKPFDRIKVALAGPIVNLVFALLLFTAIWGLGGREKPFAEFTQRVGWVDPQSTLFAKGLRPGDIITSYDGHDLSGAQDHFYAAMLAGDGVVVEGYHVNYPEESKVPFRYEVDPYAMPQAPADGMRTIGVIDTAGYMIYQPDSKSPFFPGSPMEGRGIEAGDRLFWADGEILFSREQLTRVLNGQKALVTVARNGEVLLRRVPRLPLREMLLTDELSREVEDWHYDAKLGGRYHEVTFIPYDLTPGGVVEGRAAFIDSDLTGQVFPANLLSGVDEPLQAGDRILAVDGSPVFHGAQILAALQSHRVNLVVERQAKGWPLLPSRKADRRFDRNVDWADLAKVTSGIGQPTSLRKAGDFIRLAPVEPATMLQMAIAGGPDGPMMQAIEGQRQQIAEITDSTRRAEAERQLEQAEMRLMLGIALQDRPVLYNPLPTTLFADVSVQTWRTFEALFMGYLSPKWLSGPVGIIQVMHYGWSVGIKEALFWLAVISFNLGILNLLPIPVLDGGHICFSLWEMATRRRIKAETMEKLIIPFVVVLIAFFVFVTYQDISRLFKGFF